MIGLKTIRQGERAAVWNKRGEIKRVDGPRRVFLFGETMQFLPLHSAGPNQYLAIRFMDGRKQHLPGPVSIYFDPVEHAEIMTFEAITVDANDALVVYRQEKAAVARRIVRGPELFVPAANEWLHQFSWHGADPKNPTRKIPSVLRFQKLRVIPDQMYGDVEDVRTADDALLTVKLMVFFELVNIETMLDQTHDPIADFINALSADVIDFSAGRTFDKFKEETEKLSDLATYSQLVNRAQRIGYRINKVVYRGYHATSKLQAMHDNAIEARTQLRLQAETEEQAQQLADLKQAREAERAVQRRGDEEIETAHENKMKKIAHDEILRQQLAELQQELDAKRQRNELELQNKSAVHREQATHLKEMREMQIDLTRYLVARYQNPDRLIRIDGNGNGRAPQLHLHE